jgi:hypothetical protein
MKKFLGLLFLFSVNFASAQILHDNLQLGEKWKNTQSDSSAGIPKDTFSIKISLRQNPKLAGKGDSLYMWSVRQQKYILTSGGSGGGSSTPYDSVHIYAKVKADSLVLANEINNRYDTVEALVDSTGFVVIKPNGVKDTVVFEITSGSGVTENFITVTKAQADILIASSSLVKAIYYKITGVDISLFGGTSIILKAVENNKFSKNGIGLFFNPRYNKNIAGYGIADTSISYNLNDTVIWGGKHWVCNSTGAADGIDILTLSNNFTSIPYDSIVYKLVYDEIDYDYENDLITKRYDAIADILVINTKSDIDLLIDYGFLYRSIAVMQWGNEYDYFSQKGIGIIKNYNSYFENCNVTGGSINTITLTGSSMYNITLTGGYMNNIKLTGGSSMNNIKLTGGSSMNNITLTGGSINTITLTGSSMYYIALTGGSSMNAITLTGGSTMNTITLTGGSYMYNITLTSGSSMNSITLTSGSMNNITLTSGSYMNNITLTSGNLNLNSTGIINNKTIQKIIIENATVTQDLSAATTIYSSFSKKIFAREDGTPRISYYNNSDVQIIVPINN